MDRARMGYATLDVAFQRQEDLRFRPGQSFTPPESPAMAVALQRQTFSPSFSIIVGGFFRLRAKAAMRRLTTRELLFLQDMCLDAEFRCHERAITAQIKGDSARAARELALREQYSQIKKAILEDLYERGNHDPLDASSLLQLRPGVREDERAATNEDRMGGTPGRCAQGLLSVL